MTTELGIELRLFRESLDRDQPPKGLRPALQAMWHQARGDWKRAHRLAQAQHDKNCAWVHGYLHRVEGKNARAREWYRRAGKSPPSARPDKEWEEIVSVLLRDQPRTEGTE